MYRKRKSILHFIPGFGLDTESAPYVHKLEIIEVEREEAFHYRLLQTERLK